MEDNWIHGEPEKAGWYIFAVRTNDNSEHYYVLQMWFNPDAVKKYWIGGGYVSNKAEPSCDHYQENVKFYQPLPSPPNNNK